MADYTYTFNQRRTFGVEIECVINDGVTRSYLRSALQAEGLLVSDPNTYRHTGSDNAQWVMKWDGSITGPNGTALRGNDRNLEIVSPVLSGMEGVEQVRKAMRVLRANCSVNRSCGLHVHHGVTDLQGWQMATLYVLYARNQKVIDMMLAPSRRSVNAPHYAHPLEQNPDDVALSPRADSASYARMVATREGRYRVVNFDSYTVRGTIEFRQHHATLDGTKVIAWLVFTQACIEFAINSKGRRILDYGTLSSFTPINGIGWRVGLPRTGDSFEAKQYYRLRDSWNLFTQRAQAETDALTAVERIPSVGTSVRRARPVPARGLMEEQIDEIEEVDQV